MVAPRFPQSEPPPLATLYASLRRRVRPEEVAQLVLAELRPGLSEQEESALRQAARFAWGGPGNPASHSSMPTEFAAPVGLGRQLAKARELFRSAQDPAAAAPDPGDPEGLRPLLVKIGSEIGKSYGENDFKEHRLNRARRAAAGLGELSRRRYNKLFRLATRLERKRATLARECDKREFTLVGKSRLAHRLTWEEFSEDPDSACFVAYLTARSHLRSEFTVAGQQRAYDDVAARLLARCRRSGRANWWVIAHVFPEPEVVGRLTDEQKGRLLGTWYAVLERIARLLREVWKRSHLNRQSMVVARGNDSTTWNNTAGAWNKAREGWFALLAALGTEAVTESFCPGKVLRLMAADVVAWHRQAGHTLSPDTAVWNALPLPWEVLLEGQPCPRRLVESVCAEHGIDPVATGWSAPRPPRQPQPFRPTPELVHGVSVGDPGLAALLRRLGFFSGKPPSPGSGSADPPASASSEQETSF